MKAIVTRTLLAALATLLLSCSQEPVGFSPAAETLNWRTISSFDSPDYVNDAWGSAPDNLYVTVGRQIWTGSPLIRFDGVAWTEVPLPSGTTSLGEIKGTSATDIWVTGNRGVLHYDGTTWTNTGVRGYRTAITQTGVAYALATSPPNYDDVVVRFNGASSDTLYQFAAWEYGGALWASDEPALVAVVNSYPSDSLLWWDGVATRKLGAPGDVWSFWGGSSAELLAAGSTGSYRDGAIWRWDGSDWIAMTIPPGTGSVQDIDGLLSNDLYAVSCCGALLHFDGASWQTSPIPTERDLSRVLALPSDLYVALGGRTLMHRAGGNWNALLGDGPYDIDLVWAESPQHLVALAGDFTVWEWSNGVWTERGGGGQDFHSPQALAGRAIDDLYATTDNDRILHYDGITWSVASDTVHVNSLAVSPSGTVFASRHDAIYRMDSAGWTRIFQEDDAGLSLYSLWVGDGDEVFAGGFGFVHLKGATIQLRLDIHNTYDLIRGISGVSSREVYLASERGLFLYDGHSLRPVGPPDSYGGVVAAPDGTVLALGYRQHALFSDGYWRIVPRTQASVHSQFSNARDGRIIYLSAPARAQRISYLDE